ncbi:hypothetical protein D6D01_08212 [Aureobasidium pullulans]|uniref:Uncharacterized protein n=1 Tax=Aureobasidium pullulans TaxID=5580 RepID=A0A4S9KG94_AURPU|nr:hypothetical protein D6D01_08212 [Aureobasidium pullulans]
MAPNPDIRTMHFGSAEAKDSKANDNVCLWAIRSTLMRIKRPDKVVIDLYNSASRDNVKRVYLDSNNPPSSPFSCSYSGVYNLNDECSVCFPQFFPASHSISDANARELLSTIVNSIKTDLAFLRTALDKHADFLVSRWKKKSREKRHNFLMQKTSLFDKKWAAVHLLDRVGVLDRKYPGERVIPKVRTVRTAKGGYTTAMEFHTPQSLADENLREETLASYQDSWILPYLDAETLSEDPTLFLSLLHHRTANEPGQWLMFDNSNIVLVEHFSIVPRTFNSNCVVAQGPKYGKLVKWNADQAHRWEIIGFTKAYHLLTAQKSMMTLLSNCVKGLVAEADVPPVLEVHPKWDGMIASDFSRFKTSFPWSTDFVKPFSQPPKFNAREVAELIASRHRVVLNELDLLQTDPRGAEFQRTFSWQHFLGAMVDAGFSIFQSQGSAITLKLNDYSGVGVKTIVLHRPHPSPTVNPVMLRRIAKRMEKWFGWHREMFVEKSKSEE